VSFGYGIEFGSDFGFMIVTTMNKTSDQLYLECQAAFITYQISSLVYIVFVTILFCWVCVVGGKRREELVAKVERLQSELHARNADLPH
jgi:uncharacterized Tic20 family protein